MTKPKLKLKIIFLPIIFFGIFGVIKNSEAATIYVSSDGSGTTCASSAPCSLTYALDTKCSAGDTVVLYGANSGYGTGTYAESGYNLNNPSKHQNLTITTNQSVKDALTFNRGIASGTDNRPYFSALSSGLTITVSGVTVEYMKFRMGANPRDEWCHVVGVKSTGNTIRYSKIWNGCSAIFFYEKGPNTVSNCELSNAGYATGSSGDTHMIGFCRAEDEPGIGRCWGTGSDNAGSWTEKTLIENNTLSGTCNGDGIQFSSADDGYMPIYEAYIEISHNDFSLEADEQLIDSKGSRYISIHDNDFTGSPSSAVTSGAEYAMLNTTVDDGVDRNSNLYWYIYNNVFQPSVGSPMAMVNGGANDNYWWVWNNVFYNTITSCFTYDGTGYIFGKNVNNMTFAHNTMIENNRACTDLAYGGVSADSAAAVIKNNLFYNNGYTNGGHGSIATRDGSNATVDYNFVYPTTCPSGFCMTGNHYQSESNSQVADAAGGDFHLASDSVASYQSGTPLTDSGLFTPSLDKDGENRNNPPSLGAYEYISGGGDTTPPSAPQGLSVS